MRALRAHTFHELHSLAVGQRLEAIPLNFREMYEEIFSILGLNKTITFALIKPLYGAF
ncbi:protein of unknown function [Nitrospina watsonii]|uniref:Uncharacterized protein n=1 Tax=Nitrospina watsonii TaxID=1323948 RepID=A0ABN8W0E7_9BACT|nr:protein of unknown function [Nitrospina watsonii]